MDGDGAKEEGFELMVDSSEFEDIEVDEPEVCMIESKKPLDSRVQNL